MSNPYPHLNEAARRLLDRPRAERLQFFNQDRWIHYEGGRRILSRLDLLLSGHKRIRMHSLAIVGNPNNGKTSLINYFADKHPPFQDGDGDTQIPVVRIETPTPPSEKELYTQIMLALGIPFRTNDTTADLRYRVFQLFLVYRVKMLMLDEFHHIESASGAKQREMLDILKSMSNRLKISIVVAGLREAVYAMQLDKQFSSRFLVLALEAWSMNKEWRQILATFERIIPLPKPSKLDHPEFARVLLEQSDKTIGGLKELLEELARHAIMGGHPCITPDMIKQTGWVRSSDRIRHAQSFNL